VHSDFSNALYKNELFGIKNIYNHENSMFLLLRNKTKSGMGESKVQPRTGHEDSEEELRYTYTLYFTSALNRGGWSTPRLGSFPLGKTQYPLYKRLDVPQGQYEQVLKISPPPGFEPRTVETEARKGRM
jgi:hypothetical protein